MIVSPTFVVVAAVQVSPPSLVYTIVPSLPTATPLFASTIETPSNGSSAFVVVAFVQVSPPSLV